MASIIQFHQLYVAKLSHIHNQWWGYISMCYPGCEDVLSHPPSSQVWTFKLKATASTAKRAKQPLSSRLQNLGSLVLLRPHITPLFVTRIHKTYSPTFKVLHKNGSSIHVCCATTILIHHTYSTRPNRRARNIHKQPRYTRTPKWTRHSQNRMVLTCTA